MKNNKSLILLISLLAVTSLTGCNSKKEKEISEEMVTEVINQTNINADVHIGEYESMLTGAVEAVPEGADLFTSSTILDAPRDFETSIYYSDESNNLQAVTNLLNNIQTSNDVLGTIVIKEQSGKKYSNNLLTLANAGTELKIVNPNGYKYGEVYQIEINDAPYLSFVNKSTSIRTLTIEIEDDPNEEKVINDKKLKSNITDIDINKVSNKLENTEEETFSFIYEGSFPNLNKGDIFHAHKLDKEDLYFDFYGEFINKEDIDNNHTRINYLAPKMNQIYDEFHLKDIKPVNFDNPEILLNDDLASDRFKSSGLARGITKALLARTNGDVPQVAGILDTLNIHIDFNYVNNRVSFMFLISASNIEVTNKNKRWFFSLDIGYEKVTDYYVDFDVDIETSWIIPTGINYKVKSIEDCQEGFYLKISFSKALQPDRSSRDPQVEKDFIDDIKQTIEQAKEGHGAPEHIIGDEDMKPSTSGSRTTWPIVRLDIFYFSPLTFKLEINVYIDAAFQLDLLVKKETFSTKVDFCFTNMEGCGQDEQNKVLSESNWVFAFAGSIYIELGVKASFSFSILGLYDYLRAQAYATWYVNLSATGMLILDISVSEAPTRVSGYIGIDLAVTSGVKVGLNFKILCYEINKSYLLWFEYLFRIKYENSIEHFSPVGDDTIEMDGLQTKNIDDTDVLWVSEFNTITMSLQERQLKAKDEFSIFSGVMANWIGLTEVTSGRIFSFKVEDESLMSINSDGVIHIKDGTPNEFTTSFTIHVSDWCGTASDKKVNVHFIARDTKELYSNDMYIGTYRPGYEVILPEGPKEYGKEFLYYSYNGNNYNVGDKFVMPSQTTNIQPIYRLLKYCTVRFFDGLGNCISNNRILEFEAAIEPSEKMRDRYMIYSGNYIFLGWDADFSYITDNLDIHGIYMEVK